MVRWYVKDLATITRISVQTLHHYDRIALLRPSGRLDNGYRVYTEKDLLKLQQIIALKYFGFELKQIKTLLSENVDLKDQLRIQSHFLEEKAQMLKGASEALRLIISKCGDEKSLPWETIIQLIEVFRMTQELEKTWAGKVLSPSELKDYARFEHDLSKRFSPEEKLASEKAWNDLVQEAKANIDVDPTSDIGFDIAKRLMKWVNGLYGAEHAQLRHSIWHNGYMKGQIDDDGALDLEVAQWIDKAIDHFYRTRIHRMLGDVGKVPDAQSLKDWNALAEEMYGNNESGKTELLQAAISNEKVSIKAKNWLRGHFASKLPKISL